MKLKLIDHQITIPEERLKYNEIRKDFIDYAETLREEFTQTHMNEFLQSDFLGEKWIFNKTEEAIDKGISFAVKYLFKYDIFNIDKNSFIEGYDAYEYLEEERDSIISVRDQEVLYLLNLINEINDDVSAYHEYAKNRRIDRTQFEGFGAGISGAMKGVFVASIANTITDTFHKAINERDSKIVTNKASEMKDEIINDIQTIIRKMKYSGFFDELPWIVYYSIFTFHRYVIAHINAKTMKDLTYEERMNKSFEYFGDIQEYENEEQEKNAEAIFNNLLTLDHDLEIDTKRKMILDVIEKDPYYSEYYEYLIKNFGDENNQVSEYAAFFGIRGIEAFKRETLNQYFETLDIQTKKSAQQSKTLLLEKIQFLGLQDRQLITHLDEKINELDKKERTIDDILFDDEDEAKKAAEELTFITPLMVDYEHISEMELQERLEKISQHCSTKISLKYTKAIQERLEIIDCEMRTFDDIEYATREQADKIRDEHAKLNQIQADVNYGNIDSLISAIEKISNGSFTIKKAMELKDDFSQRAMQLDQYAKTFKGVTYASEEEATIAKDEYEDFNRLYQDSIMDQEALEILKLEINEAEFAAKEDLLEKIEQSLVDIVITKEVLALEQTLDSIKDTSPTDIYNFYQEVKSGESHPKTKEKLLPLIKNAVNKNMKDYNKQYEKAVKYNERKNKPFSKKMKDTFFNLIGFIIVSFLLIHFLALIGLGILVLGLIGMMMSASDEKKQWKALTDKGQKPLVKIEL